METITKISDTEVEISESVTEKKILTKEHIENKIARINELLTRFKGYLDEFN